MDKKFEARRAMELHDKLENIWKIMEDLKSEFADYDDGCANELFETQEKILLVDTKLCGKLVDQEEFIKILDEDLEKLRNK